VVAWILLPALLVLLLAWELGAWRGLATERARAAAERARLTREIQLREQELAAEMRSHATVLGEIQWSARGGDPGAFLTRLAELVQERRIKVLAIEPLESQSTPQFVKSWHTVRLLAPYREVRDLAARVEAERGIVEDMRIDQPAAAGPAPGPAPEGELQVRFRLATLDLSPQARQVLERVAKATGTAPAGGAALAQAPPPPLARDPFALPPGAVRTAGGPAPPQPPAGPPVPVPPAPPIGVTGIVAFPDGHLAIVNDQIVGAGDTVSGYRIERITASTVTVRAPGAEPRILELPELASAPPQGPRR
jgi:hypothetical protein